ncbi:MAG: hypothetical protein IJ968_01570, partial [Clostridia bacterium]|nr:hypothetical protein [Clostridia bacterium]
MGRCPTPQQGYHPCTHPAEAVDCTDKQCATESWGNDLWGFTPHPSRDIIPAPILRMQLTDSTSCVPLKL